MEKKRIDINVIRPDINKSFADFQYYLNVVIFQSTLNLVLLHTKPEIGQVHK